MHPLLQQLQSELANKHLAVPAFKKALQAYRDQQLEDFKTGSDIADIITRAAFWMDDLLQLTWQHCADGKIDADIALVAAGGYGRGELHPGSDVDLLILSDHPETHAEQISEFVTFVWDIKLELGHSVRTIDDSIDEASNDVSTATTLLETRYITGDKSLFTRLRNAIQPEKIWPNRAFFEAKLKEKEQRHQQYHRSAYRLEPNLKESPGGLRDIQMIAWVTQRHFGTDTTLATLTEQNFLYDAEYEALIEDRNFLWRVRFALHHIAGRKMDQLLFEHQVIAAEMLGYGGPNQAGGRNNLAVEAFMQAYYKTAMRVERITGMLLQLFSEAILENPDQLVDTSIPESTRFVIRNNSLAVVDESVFQDYPLAVMEAFYLYQLYPDLDGFRAQTARLIRQYRRVIDDEFRNDIRAKSLFMEIMRSPHGLTHALRQMNRFGLLGRYIPAWGKIVGMMQFDLFHRYTVDEHSLFVVSNARKFALQRFNDDLPIQNNIMQHDIAKPHLLYLAALFHDIAKGRGGDHAELGAEEAYDFCEAHGMLQADTDIIVWLVRNHLTMSTTAQNKDISDPDVLQKFAQIVGDVTRLQYLFLLTTADIRGTNPELWNSWRGSLLADLYHSTKRVLERGLDNFASQNEFITETRHQAHRLLAEDELDIHQIENLWAKFDNDYFLRHTPQEIAWHTQGILKHQAQTATPHQPLVMLQASRERGATLVFVYMPDSTGIFANVTATLDSLNLDVVDARIISTTDGYTLDTYAILDHSGDIPCGHFADETPAEERNPETRQITTTKLRTALLNTLSNSDMQPDPHRHLSRQKRFFNLPTSVTFSHDADNNRTVVELVSPDRPGLLSKVGAIFAEHGLSVQNAKIATLGERAEDIFHITDAGNQPISSDGLQMKLKRQIMQALDHYDERDTPKIQPTEMSA